MTALTIRLGDEQFVMRAFVLGAQLSPPSIDKGQASWDVVINTTLGFFIKAGHWDVGHTVEEAEHAERQARGRYASIVAQMDPEEETDGHQS